MPNASKNTSIVLGEPLQAFVGEQVATGRYGSASEVVRAGLRLLEERERKLALLRDALEAGRRSPVVLDFSLDSVLRNIEDASR